MQQTRSLVQKCNLLKRGQFFFLLLLLFALTIIQSINFSFKTGVSLHTFSAFFHDLLFNTLLISVDCQKYYNKYFSNHFIKMYFCSFIFYLTLKTNEINTKYISLGI